MGQSGASKAYTSDTISTTLVTEQDWDKKFHSKLTTTGKTACLIGIYTVHSHNFDMNISMGNKS